MKGEIYDKKEIYDQLNKDVYFKDGGSMNLASLAGSIEKIRSKSKSYGSGSGEGDSSNATKRFEAQYVRGEDNIGADGTYVTLGDFQLDLSNLDLKAGDIVDVPSKEEDITNVIFRNNGTESIQTQVYYSSQDRNNFEPGNRYGCIRYERIADLPSDSNTQMSWLIFYKNWDTESGTPAAPYFVFQASQGETESGVTGLLPAVMFSADNDGLPSFLNPDSDYIGFIENESSSDFNCVEMVLSAGGESTPTLTPKRQDDGVVSILDYYKFYYVAEGKTYVMSRDGDYARPLDITKSVVEWLREKVMSGNNESECGVIILDPDWKHMPTTRTSMTSRVASELLGCSEDDLYNIIESRYSKLLVMLNDEEAVVFYPEREQFTIVSGKFVACKINGSVSVSNAKLYIELNKTSSQYVYTNAPGGMG